jgi:D-3-phosphoglycerate dehydrogenase
MDRFKVLVIQNIHANGLAVLQNGGCEYVIPDSLDRPTVAKLAQDADAILVRTATVDRELIENAPKLKVIARHGAGVDNIDGKAAAERGIPVCNTPYANSNSVAEHTVGMMIAIAHQMFKGDIALRQGDFESRNRYIGTELLGKTLGIIGLGNIGRRVAKKCALGMDMNVIAYDPYIKGDPGIDYVRMVDSVDALVSQADFVSLHIPYVQDMHYMINRDALAKMKRSAFLINCARGGLLDEDALYDTLKAGGLAGAAMDVFEQEPPPAKHLLWELENIIVTPHMSAHTDDAMISMAVGAAEEIVRVLRSERPLSCTNKNFMRV